MKCSAVQERRVALRVTRGSTRLGYLVVDVDGHKGTTILLAAKLMVKLTVGLCRLLPVSLLTNFGDGIAAVGSRNIIYQKSL